MNGPPRHAHRSLDSRHGNAFDEHGLRRELEWVGDGDWPRIRNDRSQRSGRVFAERSSRKDRLRAIRLDVPQHGGEYRAQIVSGCRSGLGDEARRDCHGEQDGCQGW
jgi:hypothetical protein